MNSSILVSADKLKKNLLKKKIINDIVNDNLYKLNDLIDNSYKNNKDCIITNLPISFNIHDSFNHKEFQLEIYYNLIEILEKKNYKINIRILENETILKICWKSIDENNLEMMKMKLKNVKF
jgi:hypothetical protein